MTEKEIIDQAFEYCRGDVAIGDVVAHQSHKLAHRLVDIVEGLGICKLPDGKIHTWPINELSDPNKVKREAVRLASMQALNNL